MSSKIDPKYFQFNSATTSQQLRSSVSAGNVQNSARVNTTTGTSSITNKPLSAQQNRSARQHSVNTYSTCFSLFLRKTNVNFLCLAISFIQLFVHVVCLSQVENL